VAPTILKDPGAGLITTLTKLPGILSLILLLHSTTVNSLEIHHPSINWGKACLVEFFDAPASDIDGILLLYE
jgi:hypothetical protein